MEPFPYTHPQAPHGLGMGIQLSDYFVPKLEVLDTVPSSSRMLHAHHHAPHQQQQQHAHHDIPPPLTEIPILRTSKPSPLPTALKHAHYYPHEDASRSSSSSSLAPPSPPYEEDPTSPTFFVDTFTKIRNLSGELFQVAGDTLAKGYATDNVKIEYYAHELLKIARQLNNTADDDDRKRLPPPLVRPRRIRRKHNEEEEQQQQQQIEEVDRKRKLGTGATPELYCHSCGTTDTPDWRRGPDGCKSLCNACGLHYAKILRRETMIPNRQPARTTMTLNNLLN